MLTRAEIDAKAKEAIKPIIVAIPGLGDVGIRRMHGWERDKWESLCVGNRGGFNYDNARARLAAFCLCDEQGQRLYKDNEAANLGQLDAVALDAIFDAAMRHNCLRKSDVKELAGNSPSGQSEDSGST